MYIIKPRPDEVIQQKANHETNRDEPKSKEEVMNELFERLLYKAILDFVTNHLVGKKFESLEKIDQMIRKQWPNFVVTKSNYGNPDFFSFLIRRDLLVKETGEIFSGYEKPFLIATAVLENDNDTEEFSKTAEQVS